MHYTSAAAALAALTSVASAFPAQTPSWKQHFTVQQSATGRKIPISGATAYKKALAKYGATIPDSVITAVKAVQSGSVEANPTTYDSQYLSPVSVGGQTLMLDFDTGSADLWCFSTELPSNQQNGQALYDPTKSATASKKNGYSWKISYGDQSGASGDVYADKVTIGGVTATSQAVEAATSVSSQFSQDAENDGLVGFAFSTINTVTPQQQNTWFDTVKSSLPQQLFAVTLKYQQPGTYDFGFIDSSKYDGSLTYTAVDSSQGFWSFTADGYSVGGTQSSDSLKAIADTGTSLILVSADVVSAYYAKVTGSSNSNTQGGYIFPCTSTLPDFGIVIEGQTFTVPGKYINYAPIGDGTCYGGIQSSAGIGFNILGDVFLKAQYVVFDAANMQLGFAPQAGLVATPPPASNATFVPRSTYPRVASPRLDFNMLEKRVPKAL